MQYMLLISSIVNMLTAIGILISIILNQRRSVLKEKREKKESKKKTKALNVQRKLDDAALEDLNSNLRRIPAIPVPGAPVLDTSNTEQSSATE